MAAATMDTAWQKRKTSALILMLTMILFCILSALSVGYHNRQYSNISGPVTFVISFLLALSYVFVMQSHARTSIWLLMCSMLLSILMISIAGKYGNVHHVLAVLMAPILVMFYMMKHISGATGKHLYPPLLVLLGLLVTAAMGVIHFKSPADAERMWEPAIHIDYIQMSISWHGLKMTSSVTFLILGTSQAILTAMRASRHVRRVIRMPA